LNIIAKTKLEDLELLRRGKVREMYALGDHILMVTSDRISAYDVIMDQTIPLKGEILTSISLYWFEIMKDIVRNHVITANVSEYPEGCQAYADDLEKRSILVERTEPLPVECIVRGFISGSGWKDYLNTQSLCGIELPAGLSESEKLEEPLFTPSTKAEDGHDQNISFEKVVDLIGSELAQEIRDYSIRIYIEARKVAETKGIIIADTKMEFGLKDGELILIDELLTPDSSRFWPADKYEIGRGQPSFDKQFLRDYLSSLDWDKTPPPPTLPQEIIRKTSEKYQEALRLLTN